MRICLAGDTHGNSIHMQNVFTHARRMDADLIVQLGDFGYGWSSRQVKGGKAEDEFSLNVSKFARRTGIDLWWLGGNHENYDLIEDRILTLPGEEDGTIEYLPGVRYIPRGVVLDLDGVRFLTCGGACSVDQGYRELGRSYWIQELTSDADVARCAEAGKVDVVLTHDFPFECEVVDRHLSPLWGEKAQRETIGNRRQISRILAASGAKRLVHGHLHHRYDEMIMVPNQVTRDMRQVHVTGLDCDGTLMQDSTYFFDTAAVHS